MIALKINNEFLDMPANSSMELQRNNPLLGNDEIEGEYSLPVNINYTDKNYRLLNYAANWYATNKKALIDAELYDNGNYKYSGKLLIQQHNSSINNIRATVWNGIFTINSSSFFQDIKDIMINQVDLGGTRAFPWTTSDPTDGSNGFWQHYHAARVPDAFDYTFYPILNPIWSPEARQGTADIITFNYWMNLLDINNNFEYGDSNSRPNMYSAVPAIYVKFILNKIFEQAGWKLTGTILSDPGFQKLTMVGLRGIEWLKKRRIGTAPGPIAIYTYFQIPVIFDLKDFVPEGLLISKFIIDLKNRFGWSFSFDTKTKTASINALKDTITNIAKDWTKYAISGYNADFKEVDNKYSLINNIDPADEYPLTGDISRANLLPAVQDYASLPDPSLTEDNAVCFAFRENIYYINQFNVTANAYQWELFAHNIGNYINPDAKLTIESDISTMPTIPSPIRFVSGTPYYGLVPACQEEGNHVAFNSPFNNWSVRLLFYHGLKPDSSGLNYPYASCHSTDYYNNNDLTPWSIPYKREFFDVNNGVYDYWYKDWLNYIQSDDIRTIFFKLPAYELAQFAWPDRIRVNEVEYIVVSYKEIVSYPGIIEFKMKRVF